MLDIGAEQLLNQVLGKPPKQIFGKSWDFGPTGFAPPPSPNVGIPKKEKKK